jgi:hypothetical protein
MPRPWQWGTTEQALKVTMIALADRLPQSADAAYLYGNTPDNEGPVLKAGLDLYENRPVSALYLCGVAEYRAKPDSPIAYAGAPAWRTWLREQDVRDEDIRDIEGPPKGVVSHTGTEAQRLILLAKKEGWENLFIVAPPFHMPRCLINTVSMAIRHEASVRIYCVPGRPDPWHESAVHSQGLTSGKRIDLIDGEWQRINTWYDNDLDLEPADKILKYLAWRDSETA